MTAPRHPLPPPCPHLAAYTAHSVSKPIRSLHRCLRHLPPFRVEILRSADEIPRCLTCFSTASPRLLACLSCAAVSCNLHAPLHPHPISIDIHRAELFCSACGDQVYDAELDAAVVMSLTANSPPAENLRKRRRIGCNSPQFIETLNVNVNVNVKPRGMCNLGNTCFMNSVLQAVVHVGLMREYFLGDGHDRVGCRERRRRKGGRGCLVCDLEEVYAAVFSGDRRPYSPARFLYSWWQHASNLASYEQQDAHEFFISMLDGIHEKLAENEKNRHFQGSGDCCIAHKVFSGILRSDVTCINCGFTSTTYDPCVDFSLDLDSSQRVKKEAPSISQACNGQMELFLSSQSCPSLMGCLERFTRPERLGSDQKFFCQRCQLRQESLKQMSIRKLPLVICFHIKRFEHSSVRKASRKVDNYLQFPFSLDMSPYLSSSILRSRFGNRIFASETDDSDASTESATKFELLAVITHSGKLEAGHYITYLRLDDLWYKCDDAWITLVNENIVRASQAYMLFYVQRMCYEANENPVAS